LALKSAFDSARLQFQVASAWFQTQRSAQGTAFEEGLEGSREDFPPSMRRRQLLRSFNQATKELGDGPKRLGGGSRAGVHAGDSDSGLSRMARLRIQAQKAGIPDSPAQIVIAHVGSASIESATPHFGVLKL
jgi:hypothetical protein